MAVYFDHRLDSAGPSGINNDLAWFPGPFPLLAVSTYSEGMGGNVNIFNEEGEKLQHKPLTNQTQVSCIVWHPTRKIVAVGWQNGELSVWNEQEREIMEPPHLHKGEITIMHWSSNGSRFVSGDNTGMLMVWRSDSRGRMGPEPVQHHLQEPLGQIAFRPPAPQDPSMDIASLARAAVSGDESALDMFSWKPGTKPGKAPPTFGSQESLSFFVGGQTGGVYFVSETAQCRQCFNLDHCIIKLLFYQDKNAVVTLTDNLLLTQHAVMPDGDTKELLKVKLSGRTDQPSITWAGKGILASASGEGVIRLWDLEQSDNYVLSLDGHSSYDQNESLLCVSFNPDNGVLAAGTNMGNIALWKFTPSLGSRKKEGDELWSLQAPATVEGPVRKIEWYTQRSLMAVNTVANVFILSEHVMSAGFCAQTAVVQYAPSSLSIEAFASATHHDLKTDIQVKGICATKDALAVWNGKRVILYEFSADKASMKASGQFPTESMVIVLYEQNIYTIEQGKVQVRTFQGTVKQLLTFSEPEGRPVSLDVCGHYLVVATDAGVVRVFDLSRREAKAHTNPKNLADIVPGFGSVVSAKVSCNGSRVSILLKKSEGEPDAKLYFWDVELDTVQYFNFESGHGEQDDYPAQSLEDKDTNDAERGKNQAAKDIAGRYPVSHFWDAEEPRLVVCEAKVLAREAAKDDRDVKKRHSLTRALDEGPAETMAVSLFCTSEQGVLIQDSFSTPPEYSSLIGIEIPYLYFVRKSEAASEEDESSAMVNPETGSVVHPKMVARKIMRDFVGLEASDKATRDAMISFCFHLTTGNMDEAFKSIKLIKSESVWENMAKMCVKSRRLDVASVCLGNMGHARGAKALREAQKEPELDARVAILAIQLGLTEDAERLFKNCRRYDLLNEFYQNSGQWDKALETAEMYDRIHLRTTYYNYARHLEERGDMDAAIPNYEKSETHRFEVPRMLVDDPELLEQYVSKSKDKTLRRWWAQYMESTGDMEAAVQFYETSQDFFSLVRVFCYCGEMDKAARVCNDTGDKAACYYLARQYENQEKIKEAVNFFTRAQAFGSAIRLCKEHGFEDQLVNLALMGRREDMMEAARHYEQRTETMDRAVMLYHKAGNVSKALDLAFSTKQFGALQLISSDLDERADPQLLERCANFFIENGQNDKAVDLLAIGKKYWEAVKICMDQHVEITEDLAEKLTPGKDADGKEDSMERIKLLEALGEVCMLQGQYHLATKKFTQAGNKVKAMKALLKSGDTEKIVFFAGVSRQKEIYVMAANYLQSLDWRKDPEIMKNIIGFYTKGRALDSLASFYEACAQVEVDEYQNYEKALGALGESYKCMSKSQGDESVKEERLGQLRHKMTLIKKFITARGSYDEHPEDSAKQCQVLLEESDLNNAVRLGDVYGFLIEHYARKERWKAAHAALDEMRNRIPGAQLAYYVNMKTIEAVHRALDIPLATKATDNRLNGFGRGAGDDEDGEFVEEEVIDDMYPSGDNV